MMFGLALTGLQDFIYDVADAHAARRLRIRSAILNLLPAVVALQLRKQDQGATIHYLGGGKFLASASQTACGALDTSLKQIYAWLSESSGGKLGVYWARAEGTGGTATALQRLLAALAQAKW